MAYFPENRARRVKIEKIRPVLICNIPPIIYKKWSYFFDFRPLGLRTGKKGQNQGHSPRAFGYGLLMHLHC